MGHSGILLRRKGSIRGYFVFETEQSRTCKWISNSFGDGLIDFGSGSVLQDVVQIGDENVGPLQFGYLDDYGFGIEQVAVPTATILGSPSIHCSKIYSNF